ncbi:homoserine dehydrogenase [Neobacillus niacini]|uniref:homoserine dehydrogenase n=1 Tax=Neobacillus niacini TaxID=86668 RepID=UPI0021CB3F83|nr:homoserine dehydrogenase [Neobacillus niacini]MCM3764835.1 homoserine dehydrogenase [Neobacillus niacini]
MAVLKVAILGFGTVGEGAYRTIISHGDELAAVLGKKVEVAAVLIRNKQKKRDIAPDVLLTTDFEEILQLPQLDIVIEAIVDKEPTFTYLKQAIERGSHIITANKEMFAHHGSELQELAEKNNVSIGFEATVAGGIPVIQTLRQLLKINRVQQIQGILNGTSNFILTEMREKQQSFAESLALAQKNGYAEADPTNDVEGYDAFYKTMILSRIAFGEEPDWHTVERVGITGITSELIEAATKLDLRFKHVASLSKEAGQIKASVKPVLVGNEHPFYHVEGVENAVNVYSDIVGRITLQGPGAGMFPTASAVIEDLVYVYQNRSARKKYAQTTAAHCEHNEEKKQELWLVQGIHDMLPAATIIDEVGNGIKVIKAAKSDLEQLEDIRYFAILGEVEQKEAVVV